MKTLLISGKSGSGKDMLAKFIQDELVAAGKRTIITHYGDPVKYFAKEYFGWDGVKDENGRHLLQYLGTDLVRSVLPNYWTGVIIGFLDAMEPHNQFDVAIIADVRFPNEKAMVEELGGDCWFVIRTTIENVSNHESETSIKWNDCWNKIIINDSTLSNLLFKWETFIDNYKHSCAIRDKEFNRILENGSTDMITPLSIYDMLFLSKALFTYIPKTIEKDNVKSISMNEDHSVFITYADDSMELVENPLAIEELKLLL